MGPIFARSYYALYMARQLSDGFNRNGNMPPYAFGSGSSRLLKNWKAVTVPSAQPPKS